MTARPPPAQPCGSYIARPPTPVRGQRRYVLISAIAEPPASLCSSQALSSAYPEPCGLVGSSDQLAVVNLIPSPSSPRSKQIDDATLLPRRRWVLRPNPPVGISRNPRPPGEPRTAKSRLIPALRGRVVARELFGSQPKSPRGTTFSFNCSSSPS